MEQETSTLREPPTSSASSQSETQPEWGATGGFHYGSRATVGLDLHQTKIPNHVDKIQPSSEVDDLSIEPDEFWPQSNSEDDSGSDVGGSSVLKR